MLIFLNDINALHKRDPYVFRIKRRLSSCLPPAIPECRTFPDKLSVVTET